MFAMWFYADPGSGTLIWQLLAAAGFGLMFYSKVIVRKIRILLGKDKSETDDSKHPAAH